MATRIDLDIDVLEAARQRIAWCFDTAPRLYLSFSGGKDSTIMLHLAAEEARQRGRRFGVLIVDLEAQYRLTIEHIQACLDDYADVIEPYWVCLPLALRNAVSQYEPKWECWSPDKRDDWVRQPPPIGITDPAFFPFFERGMEFEDFVPAFGEWYAQGKMTLSLVGIRTDESLNRWRTIMRDKVRLDGKPWTTWTGGTVWNAYPVYDWRTPDIWTYHARHGGRHNRLYDRMHQAGLSIHQMRICQPYGDDQRKGLWLYHVIEPETWPRVVARVNGANAGALYAMQSGPINGRIKVDKPLGHTWQSYTRFLLESMPPASKEHFENKIAIFLRWWMDRGYQNGIPDEATTDEEARKQKPTWRRIARCLLKNDYWCKGLSFGMTKASSYERYLKVMKNRRKKWQIYGLDRF